ncbi:MAG: dTDP-4-dehydrorhamnose 3,5-epimerase family protein [Candidatus Neomarinimicrobiota bacterium]
MEIKIESVHLDAIAVIKPDAFEDERGFFLEAFREDQFRNLGLPWRFVQDSTPGRVGTLYAGYMRRKGTNKHLQMDLT